MHPKREIWTSPASWSYSPVGEEIHPECKLLVFSN